MSEVLHPAVATWFDVIVYVVGSCGVMMIGGALICGLLMYALREKP